ncbi:DotH/IcmK family type IV secretion protein (plasmid) [Shewanella xiamenensis]|uniref:DotH/IcmK family type IV secretion protein n=1 Tax=Shewanella xiamenensis TaxID=332186 RepID=A0ABT6UHT4_9GAMM|nr:DotH/IcmK family type IV secretion protein [Shewanella xiamenensis]MDI5833305.1 DotH/IcmK family type IV secretion protein [Shewanella xiamenensis]WHF57945.1 DotH/IcmK family type IV secretion protein [Shewanella xiamenensis]
MINGHKSTVLFTILMLQIPYSNAGEVAHSITEDVKVASGQWDHTSELKASSPAVEVDQPTDNRTEEDKEIDNAVYDEATGGWGGEDIRRARQDIESRQESINSLLAPLVPNQRVRTLDLSPSADSVVITTRENFNTILSFIDSVGNPWPVAWSLPGNSAYEEVKNEGTEENSSQHIIVLKAKKKYQVTNYTVALKGLDEPIVFILRNDYKAPTDFKLVFKVPKIGPKTDLSSFGNSSVSGGRVSQQKIEDIKISELDRFYSIEPAEAQVVPTSQPEIAKVWFYKSQFVVKTRFEMVADYKSVTYGAGDWKVYVLNKPEYELMFITESGVVRIGMPVDVVHNFSAQLSSN